MKYEPIPAIYMEKQLVWAWKLVGTVSGDLQGRANSVNQFDGVSDMAPVCQICGSVGGGFRKGTLASADLFVWDKAVPQLLP